ncbi:hypothetical protein K1T71_010755 [Dendrolimus kikuchii]|uniref:Uncharacterized protein n=1 Tax=Dendrolimus kikuchii TaxID=765133 RepID=A0ACC1CPZ4_9NEOP|nr:hypothetical protein K1T71_010755 [Dendrolimus kikuchii]
MVSKCALVFLALFAFAVATNVKKCKDSPFEGLKNLVDLSQCTKPPCKLKKGTAQGISITFTPGSVYIHSKLRKDRWYIKYESPLDYSFYMTVKFELYLSSKQDL